MSLKVTNQALVDDSLAVVGPQAWRVALDGEGEWYQAIPIEFSSERDAERAKRALEEAGLTSGVALRRAGQAAVLRIMVESLAW
jgi:hypothetical protein